MLQGFKVCYQFLSDGRHFAKVTYNYKSIPKGIIRHNERKTARRASFARPAFVPVLDAPPLAAAVAVPMQMGPRPSRMSPPTRRWLPDLRLLGLRGLEHLLDVVKKTWLGRLP